VELPEDYSCFNHPQQHGNSLAAQCPICGERFDFPLKKPPQVINGKRVEGEGLSRGFYGAVFLTVHGRTGRKYAVKVIPVATYAPKDQGGYGKDFEQEARLHNELSGIGPIAALQDWGEEVVRFGVYDIPCHWMEMEYVEGPTLAELINGAVENPQQIAQIAWDLLDFIQALQQRGRFHNDLHSKNIKVVKFAPSEARRQAIDPNVGIRVLDLGSAAEESRSGDTRLGDVHWVATHILDLLAVYERFHSPLVPAEMRVCAQLRRVAEFCCGVDRVRAPRPEDMKSMISAAYQFGDRPWNQPVRLASVAEHYNAQTLPAWFAPALLYDPDGSWAKRLSGPGPQLLAGMRGCGKTILLRSLEWIARAHQSESEGQSDVIERLENDRFLGLFVSCAALLGSPRPGSIQVPLHRLFLAFSREVVRNLHACELIGIGKIDYNALKPFVGLIGRIVPWFRAPVNLTDVTALEQNISTALQNPLGSDESGNDFNARIAFDELAGATERLLDLWQNKVLLFLIDDVSSRYLSGENVGQILSQLCLQSPHFGFKISTETQTLELSTPGGEAARTGRDYELFDLGTEVLAQLRGAGGTRFIEEVLQRRSVLTDGVSEFLPSQALGRQKLIDIAIAIREQPSKSPIYWGIDALAGVCVGDIGDVLQICASMISRAGGRFPISREVQHEAMLAFAEGKLFALAGLDERLYSHAVAFAEAAYLELKDSPKDRIRQYVEIFVKIRPSDAATQFPRILDLIDKGVFVFSGGTPRTKTKRGTPFVQFKLAYRKALGLTNRVPLSMRDRFELSGKRLDTWLEHPSSSALRPESTRSRGHRRDVKEPAANAECDERMMLGDLSSLPEPQAQTELFRRSTQKLGNEAAEIKSVPVRTLYTVQTVRAGTIVDAPTEWTDKHVIAGFGFENRSLGAWRNLLEAGQGRPRAATMLQYADVGLLSEITGTLRRASIPFDTIKTGSLMAADQARQLIARSNGQTVIDTTSLTKPLIYVLVSEALLNPGEVWVLHTCAAEYYPPEQELAAAVELFERKDFLAAFRKLDEVIAGEEGPFTPVSVAVERQDPSQPSLMAAFVSLKHDRVVKLLEQAPVEVVAAISPVHSAGPDTNRSKAAHYMAEYLVQRYTGKVYGIPSLSHDKAYELLLELYKRYLLDGGYNFQIALTGTKMHAVGAGMFASVASPSSVYYSKPARFDPERFTKGTGVTRLLHLKRTEMGDSAARPDRGLTNT
jgi:hypothetical protein